MAKKKRERRFPYFIVQSIDKTKKKMELLDLNSIQKFEECIGDDGKKFTKRVLDSTATPVFFDLDVPGTTTPEKKATIAWMNSFEHPDYVIVYDHRFKSVHVEYKYKVLKELEAGDSDPEEEEESSVEESEDEEEEE